MNIVLIGYRGSGKTSVGRRLADRRGMAFVDTDEVVRERFGGRTIAAIWETEGEGSFRAMECRVTAELLDEDGQVLALGGGTPVQAEARAALASAEGAIIFYLHADAATLHERITGDAVTRSERPALTELGGGAAEVAAVLGEREPIYRDVADEVIDVAELGIEEVVEAIVRRLAW